MECVVRITLVWTALAWLMCWDVDLISEMVSSPLALPVMGKALIVSASLATIFMSRSAS